MKPQEGKIAVVTGANSGLGFETTRELIRAGVEVVLACRSERRGREALGQIQDETPGAKLRFVRLDLGDLESVRHFVWQFNSHYKHLDLLINNAGIMMLPKGETHQGFEQHFGVNHLGHFALTGLLLSRLLKAEAARVVTLSSIAHKIGLLHLEDLHYQTRHYSKLGAYTQSKLANLLFSLELQRRFEAKGVNIISVAAHPGISNSKLSRHLFFLRFGGKLIEMKSAQGALSTLRAATADDVEGGEYYGPGGFGELRGYPQRVQPSESARSLEDAQALWEISEELTKIDYEKEGL